MAKEAEHKPKTIALVRDIHQRGHYKEVEDPVVRADGWLQDPLRREWYSPSNVLSVTTFTPSKWDGNGLKPGAICTFDMWEGVTSARPTGYEQVPVVIIGRDRKKKAYEVLMPDGSKKVVGERKIVPMAGGPDATA